MTERPARDSDRPIGSGPLSRSRAPCHPCCDTGCGLIGRTIYLPYSREDITEGYAIRGNYSPLYLVQYISCHMSKIMNTFFTSILRVLQAILSPLPVVYSIKIVQAEQNSILISNYLKRQSKVGKGGRLLKCKKLTICNIFFLSAWAIAS
jgi:hypothetical protein